MVIPRPTLATLKWWGYDDTEQYYEDQNASEIFIEICRWGGTEFKDGYTWLWVAQPNKAAGVVGGGR